jgi:hypothetical protein
MKGRVVLSHQILLGGGASVGSAAQTIVLDSNVSAMKESVHIGNFSEDST